MSTADLAQWLGTHFTFSHGAARARREPAVAAAEAGGTQQVVEPNAEGTPADARGPCYPSCPSS